MPFPHVERAVMVARPALVVAIRDTEAVGLLIWALMITNSTRATWRGDVAIPDAESRGLLIPSKVRTAKISTMSADTATLIGRLDGESWAVILSALGRTFPERA